MICAFCWEIIGDVRLDKKHLTERDFHNCTVRLLRFLRVVAHTFEFDCLLIIASKDMHA